MAEDGAEDRAVDDAARLADLQRNHDERAEAIGAFEAEWAAVDAEWHDKRVAVNTAYKEAAAALEAERVAQADPNRPSPQTVLPHVPDDGGAT